MNPPKKPRLAVDIGGTFTDIAIEVNGSIETAKTLTTPARPVQGVVTGIGYALEQTGLEPAVFGSVIHGTTLATNALIERRGATVGVIATEGFRDILEIGYERRYDQYNINIDKHDMIVPRDRVFSVRERIDVSGSEHLPLDEDTVLAAIEVGLAAGVESFAVCLIHSYKDAKHEQRVRQLIEKHAPGVSVSLSAEVSPEVREFDRLCTTVCNAYIKPLMESYLRELESELTTRGFLCPLFIMTSGGGITTLETAMAFPIRLVESGPSGGAIMAAKVAKERGLDSVVSFDMGGTTAKICLIKDQTPKTSRMFEIDRAARFMKGSGIPVRIPVIEMIEIGAGGGSIAGVDNLGRLRVGPKSASSDPGPACYGRGGKHPTVTDSDVVAGYINPETFAEGRLNLNPDLSKAAIDKSVGRLLGVSINAGADGISQTVDEAMANAARMHAVEQGINLGGCTMIAFGGNGPLHATRIAEKVGVDEIVIPVNPGVGSAVGFLFAPVAYDIVRTYHTLMKSFPFQDINDLLSDLENEARAIVSAGAPGENIAIRRIAFMRYDGQGHEIEVTLPDGSINEESLRDLIAVFEDEYKRQFGRVVPGMEIEVMNWSVSASSTPPAIRKIDALGSIQEAKSREVRVLTLGQDERQVEANVYWRSDLHPGYVLTGPALIVEPQTTTYVSGAYRAEIDRARNIVLSRRETGAARTTEIKEAHSTLDLQVMWDRLLAVVEEQAQVLMRAAFSPIVRECGDISAGLFDADGHMLAQAVTGTPGHINTMAEAVKQILPYFDMADIKPGDVLMTNDPWLGAGHLNDIVLAAPIFHSGKLVAFTSCTSHVYDLGGLGMGPDGSDVFDEGLCLPPMKIVNDGQVNQLIMDIMKANSRSPVSNEGDFYALIACCDVAADRVSDMMSEFGLEDLKTLGDYIISTSRRATEEAISTLPKGTFENELMIDGYDFEIKLKASMTIGGGEIITDLTGTSGHSALGINVPINYTAAYGVFALRCLVGSDVPNNAGSLAPFSFFAPKDCILNAQHPAPVAMRHTVGHMVSDLVFGAVDEAAKDLAPAEGASCLWDIPIRSVASAAREGSNVTAFATEFTHSGGTGARPGKDGLSATAFPSGVFGTQVEIAESIAPVRIRKRELIPDSGGAGRHRGGLGQIIEMESREEAPILLFAGVERTRFAAKGRGGGHEGSLGRITLGSGDVLKGKGEQVIPAGDTLVWETPGGGGYGNPLDREPEQVINDLELGLISLDQAENTYGVVITDEGTVDQTATRTLRASMTLG